MGYLVVQSTRKKQYTNQPPEEHSSVKFDLNDEQSDIRDTVRRFTELEITPQAADWDEREYFPREVYKQMGDLGLMGMTTPENYGGNLLSRLTAALAYEELAKGDM